MRRKLLILVLVLAFLIRFWDLGKNPPSLNWDEVSIGVDAYSILKTGRDQYANFLPLYFRSLDDQKSPLYIYSTTLAIAAFGKTEFSIRLTSAISGVLTVYFLYLLTEKVLTINTNIPDTRKRQIWQNRAGNIALFSSAILSITPWHVHFSRVAFEANTALMFEILGLYFFLNWIERLKNEIYDRKNLIIIFASVLSFTAAVYSYASGPLFVALLIIPLGMYFQKTLFANINKLLPPLILGILLVLPLVIQIFQGAGLTRYRATSIFYRPEVVIKNNQMAKEDFDLGQGRLSVIIHNIRIPYALTIIDNYLSHFRYTFLFTKADLPRHQIPGVGLLYFWQLPLMLIGVIFLIKNRKKLNAVILISWLFIAPIPASLTWQVPHSIRTLVMLPAFSILTAVGLWVILRFIQQADLKTYKLKPPANFYQKLKNKILYLFPKLLFITIFVVIVTSTIRMITAYLILLPYEHSAYWLYGRKQAVEYTQNHLDDFNTVHVSLALDWMYLWFLWYGNYDPSWYLNQGGTVSGGFLETQNRVGKIQFRPFDFTKDNFTPSRVKPGTLLIGSPDEFPRTLIPNVQINDLSGKPIIYIVKI